LFTELDVYYPGINFVARERLDPWLDFLCRSFGGMDYRVYVAGQLCVILVGTTLLLRGQGVKLLNSLVGAGLFLLGCVFVIGVHPSYLKFHWFPLLAASLFWLQTRRSFFAVMLSVVAAILWLITAGSLAVFGGLFSVLFCLIVLCAENREADKRAAQEGLSGWTVLIGAFIVIAGLMTIPVYEMPDYPPGAQLAPASPFLFYERPLVGPYLEPNPLVYQSYVRLVENYAHRLLLLSCLVCLSAFGVAVFGQKNRIRPVMVALLIMLITYVAVGGESIFRGDNSAYAPFPVMARLIPGLAVAGLPWLLVPFGLLLALIFLIREASVVQNLISMALVSGCFLTVPAPTTVVNWQKGYLLGKGKAEAAGDVQGLLHSPSGYVVKTYGSWIAEPGAARKREAANLCELESGKDFEGYQVQANPLNEEARLAVDGDYHTRWRTGRPQREGDFFAMAFDRPVEVIRAVLSLRGNPTDFPRGIKVVVGSGSDDLREVINQPLWIGPVAWTDKGYPYFDQQSQVILDFPQQVKAGYIKFVQTGRSDSFDWSIAEVKLYRLAGAANAG
jgi:hypothetical protein